MNLTPRAQGFDQDDETTDTGAQQPHLSTTQRLHNGFRLMLGHGSHVARVAGLQGSVAASKLKMDGLFAQVARSAQDRERVIDDLTPEEERDDGLYVNVHFAPMKRTVRMPDHKAFYLLSARNPFRVVVAACVQHPFFQNFILLSILITSITLLIEEPTDSFVADDCPRPPMFLNCSGLAAGQTSEINCPRSEDEKDFGRVWDACDSREFRPSATFLPCSP